MTICDPGREKKTLIKLRESIYIPFLETSNPMTIQHNRTISLITFTYKNKFAKWKDKKLVICYKNNNGGEKLTRVVRVKYEISSTRDAKKILNYKMNATEDMLISRGQMTFA